MDALGSENGALERSLLETSRRNDNLQIQLERLVSPAQLVKQAATKKVFVQDSGVATR